MDKKQAQALIKETFESSFDKNRFVGFVKNLLNDVEGATFIYKGNYIPDAYEQYINTLERIGKYSDGEHKIDILIVKLKKETSIERARTMQRNFIAWYLNGSRGGELKDAALVAFVAPNEEDWRFSLVKMDYRFEESKKGRMRVKEEFTPARRWSFLVGVNENSHTAQSQLVDLVADDERNPVLTQLEEAFNIEKVTKEFFEKYRELFLWTEETMEDIVKKDKKIKADFETKKVNTVDFSKKLLGQIVFLYFLQKKGWFGVKRDADWGTGPKNFLRELFEGKHGTYKNFFNDILEPLFYEALARERDDDFYSRFNCKIPFLNGGLFDPINNYDWVHTDILFPNELFSNGYKTKEGDKGNGILDIFDRYNFTVKEDEPLEKEVAVDPEMLGKVFENLLEVSDRKSKGTYYTPREIVHYMCQQSLINYLLTECNLSSPLMGEGKGEGVILNEVKNPILTKEDIEILIKFGETVSENEARVENKGKETKDYKYKLPESIRQNAELIDEKLVNIKICDPAIGSGAFPVGMMGEIVKTRNVLSAYIKSEDRTVYNFKRECIEKSLYGVDIDSSAVEIAKLRLWLSLVVDENDIKQIKPLPNLDYKIMQGNSLLEEYEGVQLFDEKLISTVDFDKEKQIEELKKKQAELSSEYIRLHQADKLTRDKKQQIDEELKKINNQIKRLEQSGRKVEENANLFDIYSTAKKKSDELKQLHKEFFETTQKRKKDELKKRIDRLEWDLVEATFKEQGKESQLSMIEEFKRANTKPFFLWKLHFSEIFLEKGGFDVVIANPPYVGHKGGQKKFFQEMKRTTLGKMFNNERMDIFYYFFHLSLNNVKQNGEIAFITTNYYVTADSAVKLRTDFKNRSGIRKLVNFNELKIFDTAQGQHNILTFLSKQYNCSFECDIYSTNRTGLANSEVLKKILNKEDEETDYYILKQAELFEGGMNYIRLFCGAGNTQASINALLNKVKQQGVLLSQICNLSQGIVTGLDKISKKHVLKFPSLSDQEGSGVFVIDAKEKEKIGNSPLLKPWFKNSDINKYKPNEKNNQWVVHLNAEISLDRFPNIKKHLLKFKEVIESRNYDSGELSKAKKLNAWWALSSSRKEFDFALPKIISPQRSYRNIFAYTEKEWVASADVYFITSKDKAFSLKYILALLNSTLYFFWLYFRGKRKGDMLELYLTPLSEVPIKGIPIAQQQPYISFIDRILTIKCDKNYPEDISKQRQIKDYESQIDKMVYELYGLTKEEIKIVEGHSKED